MERKKKGKGGEQEYMKGEGKKVKWKVSFFPKWRREGEKEKIEVVTRKLDGKQRKKKPVEKNRNTITLQISLTERYYKGEERSE